MSDERQKDIQIDSNKKDSREKGGWLQHGARVGEFRCGRRGTHHNVIVRNEGRAIASITCENRHDVTFISYTLPIQ